MKGWGKNRLKVMVFIFGCISTESYLLTSLPPPSDNGRDKRKLHEVPSPKETVDLGQNRTHSHGLFET